MANAGSFKKGEKRPGQGRPKGLASRHTVAVKDAIQMAAEGLGGTDRLIAWAKEDPANERVFWGSIYPKLLPLQVTGKDGDPIKTESRLDVSGLSDEQLRAIASIQVSGG